jgi:starch synthase
LQDRKKDLHGILNGIDYSRWNPETDHHLPANYSIKNLAGKALCKRALQESAGLKADPKIPMLGIVSRLVQQKGIDLLADTIEQMVGTGAQLVLLGMGDEPHEQACREWVARWPEQVCAWIEFSSEKAHLIEAGVDMFLMPSEFEPCGQNQLCNMRYGTIPIVHGVGGLEDSVVDASQKGGTGFKFHGYSASQFFRCLERALEMFSNPEKWRVLMKCAMKQDFSAVKMAKEYIALYTSIMDGHETVV